MYPLVKVLFMRLKKNYIVKPKDYPILIRYSKSADLWLLWHHNSAFYKVKKTGLCIIKDGEETSSDNINFIVNSYDNYVIKKIMKIPQGTHLSSTGTATVCIYFH